MESADLDGGGRSTISLEKGVIPFGIDLYKVNCCDEKNGGGGVGNRERRRDNQIHTGRVKTCHLFI